MADVQRPIEEIPQGSAVLPDKLRRFFSRPCPTSAVDKDYRAKTRQAAWLPTVAQGTAACRIAGVTKHSTLVRTTSWRVESNARMPTKNKKSPSCRTANTQPQPKSDLVPATPFGDGKEWGVGPVPPIAEIGYSVTLLDQASNLTMKDRCPKKRKDARTNPAPHSCMGTKAPKPSGFSGTFCRRAVYPYANYPLLPNLIGPTWPCGTNLAFASYLSVERIFCLCRCESMASMGSRAKR